MKNAVLLTLVIVVVLLFSQGCATIVGGQKYQAHVKVKDNPNATITYKGNYQGNGSAVLKVKRVDADNFTFVVKEKDCKEQSFNYSSSVLRGGALVGTLLGWTGITPTGIPLPWGILVDMSTGALWKPDISEGGIQKIDYDNFTYVVEYTGCEQQTSK